MDNFGELKEKILDVENQLTFSESISKVIEGMNDQGLRVNFIEKNVSLNKRDIVHIKENQKKTDRTVEKVNDSVDKIEKVVLTNSITVINIDERTKSIKDSMSEFIAANKESIPKANKAIRNTLTTMITIAALVSIFISFIVLKLVSTQEENVDLKIKTEIAKSKQVPIISIKDKKKDESEKNTFPIRF